MKIILSIFLFTLNVLFLYISAFKLRSRLRIRDNQISDEEKNSIDYFMKSVMKSAEIKGHYEKRNRDVDEYIYVPGLQPTGFPNAYVVSEDEAS